MEEGLTLASWQTVKGIQPVMSQIFWLIYAQRREWNLLPLYLKQTIFPLLLHTPKHLPTSLKLSWCTNGQQRVSQISQQIHAVMFSATQRRHLITNTNYQHAPSHERTSYECMFVTVASVHRFHYERLCIVASKGLAFSVKTLGTIRQ